MKQKEIIYKTHIFELVLQKNLSLNMVIWKKQNIDKITHILLDFFFNYN